MSEKHLINTFTAMRRKFMQVAMRLLSHEEDAEDALQDAFCRLWPRRDCINDNNEAEALATTTVRNICIDKLRKKRLDNVPVDEQRDNIEEEEENDNEEREELFNKVETIIETQLTPLQYRIFKEREYNCKEIEEIAYELTMQPTAVRMQLSRARKRIREIYKNREQ